MTNVEWDNNINLHDLKGGTSTPGKRPAPCRFDGRLRFGRQSARPPGGMFIDAGPSTSCRSWEWIGVGTKIHWKAMAAWWFQPTPLKNMSSSVSWNHYSQYFPIYGKMKAMFQTTNQLWGFSPKSFGDRSGGPSFELPFPLTLHLALGLILILLDLGWSLGGVLVPNFLVGVEMGHVSPLMMENGSKSKALRCLKCVGQAKKLSHRSPFSLPLSLDRL